MENSAQIKMNSFRDLSLSQRNNQLLNMVYYDRPEELALLIDAGVELDTLSQAGEPTALIYAAANGRLLNVALLIQAGANLEAKTKWQETALSCAIKKNYLKVAFLLFNAMSCDQLNNEINLHPAIKPVLDCFNNSTTKQCAHILQLLDPLFFDKRNKNNFALLNVESKYHILFNYFLLDNKLSKHDVSLKENNTNKVALPNKNKLLVFSDSPDRKNKISPRPSISSEIDPGKMNRNAEEKSPLKEKVKLSSFFKTNKS